MDMESSTPDASETPNNSTLYDVIDSKHDRIGRVGRRVILSLMALFVATALAGVFGQVASTTSESPGHKLTVTAPRTTKAGVDATSTLHLHSTQAISGPITVEVEQEYLDAFSTYDISPAPDGESSDGRFLVLDYDAPDENAFRLDINGVMGQDSSAGARGEVRIYIDDELVASAILKTWKVL